MHLRTPVRSVVFPFRIRVYLDRRGCNCFEDVPRQQRAPFERILRRDVATIGAAFDEHVRRVRGAKGDRKVHERWDERPAVESEGNARERMVQWSRNVHD